jgi:LasA protease
MPGGPHGWAGSDTPYSSIDLAGGDQIVRAAGSGSAYLMCRGWIRIAHSTGYSTDYYHLWDNISPASGSAISEGAYVGYTGTDITCGGAASARHVHFSLLADGARSSLYQKSFGKWVFWPTTPYNGYATHGSTVRYPGGGLYNYGRLGSNQGIVDSNGGPGTGYPIVGSVADGATVTISCWRNGTSHTGRYGATSVWDKLSDGTWVSDAYVYTGTSTIGPQC